MSAKKTTKASKAKTTPKKTTTAKKPAKKPAKKSLKVDDVEPLMAEFQELSSASTRTRRNASSTIVRSDKYKNIKDGLVPWKYTNSEHGHAGKDAIDIEEAVALCQKAYYNFAVFRNTIDLMTEFSVNDIYLRGGSKKSRAFLEAFFNKVNLMSFMDKFFREYYRSGNVFVYRFDALLRQQDLKRITQTFGSKRNSGKVSVPSRYIILNPADVRFTGGVSFSHGLYSKQVTDYELQKLRNPETEEEKEIVKNLPPEVRKALNSKSSSVLIPLDVAKINSVFYKKQDYEPFAVPMGYPVLEDINAKYEMKKIDMAIARTMQQAILLVTMGSEPDKGGINQKHLEAMQKLFANESVGRVLIADYTTKAEFVVPKIGELLDSKKYEIFDKDIRIGLNNILIGEDEKFANTSIKVKVFIERLKQARETFINDFLAPEIKRVCRQIGLKNYPTPYFEDIDLRDGLAFSRVYTRLVELGILTAEEGISAIETGRLPNLEESLESQEKFKELRESGLYQPVIGGAVTTSEDNNEDEENAVPESPGRPSGTEDISQEVDRQPTDNIDSAPSLAQEELYSLDKVKNNLIAAQKLHLEVEKTLREKHEIKRLSNKQKEIATSISELIVANEEVENWNNEIENYINSPIDKNAERIKQINEIACKHQIDTYLASILYASVKEEK